MAQQARPKVIGHMLDCRAQLIACSSEVVMTLSSKRPSSHPMKRSPNGRVVRLDQWSCPAPTSSRAGGAGTGATGGGALSARGDRTPATSQRVHKYTTP